MNWLSVDIEITEDRQLACVGFALSEGEAFVVPARTDWQVALIRELCESDVPKVLCNGQFDRFFLRHFCGIELRGQTFDVQLGWHALQPELAGKKTETRRKSSRRHTVKSLKFLSSVYLRVPFWKSYQFQSEMDRYVLCGQDVCNTLAIARAQAAQLAQD